MSAIELLATSPALFIGACLVLGLVVGSFLNVVIYRLPLMLRYVGGADYQTIAKQLALTNGSLRGLLQRGLKLLREKYR